MDNSVISMDNSYHSLVAYNEPDTAKSFHTPSCLILWQSVRCEHGSIV